MPDSSSAPGFTYRAFISYSHADKAWADWLHKALETYRVPARLVGQPTAAGSIPRRLNPVFRDREELSSSPELGSKINQALAQSERLIVLCSPAAATSRWVNEEVLAWKRMGRAEHIFCLIIAGEPNASALPGRESEECFCPALRFQLDADGHLATERTEPIAADARPGKDGRANAKLKLIAGMLGVGFDALKQREQHRRMRRMALVTALAVVVMAAAIILSVFALVSRHAAVEAQHKAVIAQQAAQRRQKQAEGLVNFMLGDLNDKLAQVSRLDIMQAVDDKAMAYFQSLPNTDVTPVALAQRAKALEKIGSVRMDQGRLSAALAAFDASTKISARLAQEQPTDVERQVAYSRTLAFIGMAHWGQGKLDDALHAFESAQQTLRAPLAHSPNDPKLLIQSAYVNDDIGHVFEARGQTDGASAAYNQMLHTARQAVAVKPDNTEYRSLLGAAHNNVGKLALQGGDLGKAIAEYSADDAIETRLSERNPRDNDQRDNMLRVRAILGRTLALAGATTTGTRHLQQAVATASQLVQVDRTQTSFQEQLALYSAQLARLQRLSGDLHAARTSITRSIAVLVALLKTNPASHTAQNYYAYALTERAAESLAAHDLSAARSQVQRACTTLEPMLAKHPNDRDTLLATMTAKLLLAETSVDRQTAQGLREAALRTMRAAKTDRNDPRLLALQVEALLALGKKPEAQPLLKQLWTSGYRDPALLAVLSREHIDYPVNTVFAQRLAAITRTADSAVAHPAAPATTATRTQAAIGGTEGKTH